MAGKNASFHTLKLFVLLLVFFKFSVSEIIFEERFEGRIRKKRMQREVSAAAPHRKRKSSIVAEMASTSVHKINPEKEMMKKKKKKLRAKPLENIEAFVADVKTQLESSKSLLTEQEAMMEEFQGVVTQMRELNELRSRMNLDDQLLADYIYNNLL